MQFHCGLLHLVGGIEYLYLFVCLVNVINKSNIDGSF